LIAIGSGFVLGVITRLPRQRRNLSAVTTSVTNLAPTHRAETIIEDRAALDRKTGDRLPG
jgi:hypothetical protein